MTDLLVLTRDLVAIPSVSRHEAAITDYLETQLTAVPGLEVTRVGDNLVARTDLGREHRVVLAGHTDTVPSHDDDAAPVLDGDRVRGVGAADMKSGIAVMLELARTVLTPAVDVSYVFYAREEIAAVENGLGELAERRPDLLRGDVALLGEPTDAALEAGCQGTMRLRVVLRGERAHTARPWLGRNAIHRLGRVLALIEAYEPRRVVIDGCEFREALQAVTVSGGVSGNVVPDRAELLVNHRFAPDQSSEDAEAHIRRVLAPALEEDDSIEVVDRAEGALPGLDHPLLARLIARNHLEVRAKLGWTDVARFAALGVPAANFGPGDATVAHTAGEYVNRAPIERVFNVLRDLLLNGVT
ncbi:MAG: succinyl-diaminopimelate desuccinylase [Acidimicrobiales bacterium]|nr:succinyl-diaminopimelate desuccinylase [Acidimicrobiales bacterium]